MCHGQMVFIRKEAEGYLSLTDDFFLRQLTLYKLLLKENANMRKNEIEKVTTVSKKEGIFTKAKKRLMPAVSGAIMAFSLMSTQVFAADTSAVTAPLDNLKTLVIAIIGTVGVIILAKNVMEFAQAYQQQDSSTMNSALKGIVAGVMMAAISSVLTILGF